MSVALVFPAGKIKTVPVAATAGDVITNISPPAGKRWVLCCGTLTLTCTGVANRTWLVQRTDGTNIVHTFGYSTTPATDGQVTDLDVGSVDAVRNMNQGKPTGDVPCYLGLRNPVVLDSTDQLRITVSGGLAGDSYEGFFVVREMDA